MNKLEKPVTKLTAIAITIAVCNWVVTANAEQIPKICKAIGLFLAIGSNKRPFKFTFASAII